MKYRYAYFYGNPGRRKMRSPWFKEEYMRNMYAAADKANGFRVRLIKQKLPSKPASKKVV